MSKRKSSGKHRSGARQKALQALYQWGMSQESITSIEQQFLEEQDMAGIDVDYFGELLKQIPKQLEEIDSLFTGFLDRPLEQLDPIEKAILRISSYELSQRIDVPYKAVINEGVQLAKDFGADDSHKYVNGILDKVVDKIPLRVKEIGKRTRKPAAKTKKVVVKKKRAKISVKDKTEQT